MDWPGIRQGSPGLYRAGLPGAVSKVLPVFIKGYFQVGRSLAVTMVVTLPGYGAGILITLPEILILHWDDRQVPDHLYSLLHRLSEDIALIFCSCGFAIEAGSGLALRCIIFNTVAYIRRWNKESAAV